MCSERWRDKGQKVGVRSLEKVSLIVPLKHWHKQIRAFGEIRKARQYPAAKVDL